MQNEMIFDPAEFFVLFAEDGTYRFREDDMAVQGYVRRADSEGLLVELATGNPVVAEWSVVNDASNNPLALDIAKTTNPELPENSFLRARDLCARAAKEVERICSVPYEIAERFYPFDEHSPLIFQRTRLKAINGEPVLVLDGFHVDVETGSGCHQHQYVNRRQLAAMLTAKSWPNVPVLQVVTSRLALPLRNGREIRFTKRRMRVDTRWARERIKDELPILY